MYTAALSTTRCKGAVIAAIVETHEPDRPCVTSPNGLPSLVGDLPFYEFCYHG